MARIGFFGGKYEVYVWTDDTNDTPHVHVRDKETKGGKYETCVRLDANEYALHGPFKDRMDSAMCEAFNAFMHAPCEDLKFLNNYDLAVVMWNCNNDSISLKPKYDPYGYIIMHDYTSING